MGADEVEAAAGFPSAGIAAWATEEDLEDVERFACGYAARAGVAMVLTGMRHFRH